MTQEFCDKYKTRDSIDIPTAQESEESKGGLNVLFEQSEGIPLDKLGPENPILDYGDIPIYEDEFGDRGFSRVNVRYRVM